VSTPPAITVELWWRAIQDLKKDPRHQNKSDHDLATEALKQLELLHYRLEPPTHLTSEEFAALQVDSAIYAHFRNLSILSCFKKLFSARSGHFPQNAPNRAF
jgi:hypothetical protein